MAKTKISEFNANPALNTDIDSINIAEGCSPSGINDAIRELMAQLKDFQTGAVGDSFNGPVGTTTAAAGAFTTLSASGNVTLSGGTANGVAYLNGSKVLTTGSALTFDGTSLGIGSSAYGDAGTITASIGVAGTTAGGLQLWASSAQEHYIQWGDSTTGSATYAGAISYSHASDFMRFWTNSTEQMRLTSTGLGIGTSSWSTSKLYVLGNTTNYAITSEAPNGYGALNLKQTSGNTMSLGMVSNGLFIYDSNAGTTRLTLDSSGNLGLGVTPSAWSGYKPLQAGSGASFGGYAGDVLSFMGSNTYNDNTNWKYILSGNAAARYQQSAGTHAWYTAPSGTAGNAITFTQAMTLTAGGNLFVGSTTAPTGFARVSLVGGESSGTGANSGVQFTYNSSTYGGGAITTVNAAGGGMSFYTFTGNVGSESYTERARIDSSGNLLVGTTNASGTAGLGFKVLANATGAAATAVTDQSTNGGQTNYNYYSTGAGAYRFYVGAGGTVYATSTTITAISDQRLKENIRDLDEGLETVMALKPRKFDWKAGKGADIKNARGFIAQEFETVLPDMIETWKDPAPEGEEPYKAINANLIPTLVKAIQELKAEFDAYKASHP